MKSERLMNLLGGISPYYIKESAPGNVPSKEKNVSFKRRMIPMIAAMVAVSMMMFALGFTASALAYDQKEVPYQTGTLLTDIPAIMTAEDYDSLCATMMQNLADVTNGDAILKRCTAFYAKQSLAMFQNDQVKQALIEICPITQIVDVYTLEAEVTPTEENAILYWLMYYGEMNQEKLIAMYQRLYDMVEASDYSEEEKRAMRKSLPEIPLAMTDMQIGTLINAAAQEGKTLPTPGMLPIIMTKADFEAMMEKVMEGAGVDNYDDAPNYVRRMAAYYAEYNPDDEHNSEWERALMPLLEVTPVYVLDCDIALWERSWLCSAMALYADIWMEDTMQITENIHSTIDASDAEDKAALHDMVVRVWEILREVTAQLESEQESYQ
ncbi:MAG: hypothetical protein IJW40_05295 [Clostridia bacterium]|nr:hypothetical protein [Clostridia bacterium]